MLRKVGEGYVLQSLDLLSGEERRKRYLFETLLSSLVFLAGVVNILGLHSFHVLYIPFLAGLSFVFVPKVVVPLGLAVPFLELNHLLSGNRLEEWFVTGSAVLVTAVVSAGAARIREERNKLRRQIESLNARAKDIASGADADIIRGDNLIPRHLSLTKRENEEMQELLAIAKHALSAESVSMFDLRGNLLTLRCSTDGSGSSLPGEVMLSSCVKRKGPVIFELAPGTAVEESAHILTPVADGKLIMGVLSAFKRKVPGRGTFEVVTLEMFSRLVTRLLHNQRVYSQIHKELAGLKILHRGSANLTTSLRTEDIAQRIIEAAHKIAPLCIALFVPRGERFEVICQTGFDLQERVFDFRNSRAGMVSKGTEPHYLSDLKIEMQNERIPVLPFKTGDEGSVLLLPLTYERELLGMLVLYSGKKESLSSHQIELLELLGNQASSSLANAKLHEEIERMASTDGLTGLFNHRTFQERLSAEFKRRERISVPLSLLLIDIDFFKKINDTYGHPAGDEVLRGVAGVVRETIRNIDIPARYGGEEFAAILPGTDGEGAQSMAERLRTAIAGKTFSIDGKSLEVTVSIGVATSPHDTDNKEGLIEKADQALYHAKRDGRNRSVRWSDLG